ncbi:MAG: hypothetical protein HYT97_00595 [Elusimicrobia bacterium]|nr:hypothetical protein [Elusimicrobiota bacterium]
MTIVIGFAVLAIFFSAIRKRGWGLWHDNIWTLLFFIFFARLMLFGNSFAWAIYLRLLDNDQGHIGFRQSSVLYYEKNKYKIKEIKGPVDYLAVGSSQVNKIFGNDFFLKNEHNKLFAMAGFSPLDFFLYESYIKSIKPHNFLLFLCEYDLAKIPSLELIRIAPAQKSRLFKLFKMVYPYRFFWRDFKKMMVSALISELFPEHKYSFVFKSFLSRLARSKGIVRHFENENNWMKPDAELIKKYEESFNRDAIAINLILLENFIRFCESHQIKVIIIEGQYHPFYYSEKMLLLNSITNQHLAKLEKKFNCVRFIPRSKCYQFSTDEYEDIWHVTTNAAERFTEYLFQSQL